LENEKFDISSTIKKGQREKKIQYLGKCILDNGWHRHFKQNTFFDGSGSLEYLMYHPTLIK
jgi:hypothetical protein